MIVDEFSKCNACGVIDYDSDIPRVGDPSASDGSLTECPWCGALDETSGLYVRVDPIADDSGTPQGYLAAFHNRHRGQQTPSRYGETEEKAREELLNTYELLI